MIEQDHAARAELPLCTTLTQREAERRVAKRYHLAQTLILVHLPALQSTVEGRASNLSATGVGLKLGRPLDMGSSIVVRLRTWRPARALTLPAKVAHVTKAADGTWLVGCTFKRRLHPKTLDSLL